MITIEDSFDFHVHSAPSLFERPYTAMEIAELATRQKVRGMVLKHHFEPSVSRAIAVEKQFPELIMLGGLVMNRHTGGIDPFAVASTIKKGGKVIWFPTVDAQNHFDYFGNASSYDEGDSGDGGPQLIGGNEGFEMLTRGPGIRVIDDAGELIPEAKEVIDICVQHDVVIGTAHLGREETFAVAKYGTEKGSKRVLLGHALWKPLGLSLDDLLMLADMGVTIEFAASISMPIPFHARPHEVVETIHAIGAERCILSSDAGAAVFPVQPECLRSYVQCLVDTGLSEEEARLMMCDNPIKLAGIEDLVAEREAARG